MSKQNIFTKLWSKIVEQGIVNALAGIVGIMLFTAAMVFASIYKSPAQIKDHEKRISKVESRIDSLDGAYLRQEYEIKGINSIQAETNRKLDRMTEQLDQNRELSEKILFRLTGRSQ